MTNSRTMSWFCRAWVLCSALLALGGVECLNRGRRHGSDRCGDTYSRPKATRKVEKRAYNLEGKRSLHLRHTDITQDPNWSKKFPVHGQGTVVFNINRYTPFSMIVRQVEKAQYIGVEVREDHAMLVELSPNNELRLLNDTLGIHTGVSLGRKESYWLSYDRFNLRVKYGKGYRMQETTILEYDYLAGLTEAEQELKREEMFDYFNPVQGKVIEQYDLWPKNEMLQMYASEGQDLSLIDIEGQVEFDLNPFVANLPFVVRDKSPITLYTIEDAKYIFPNSLPQASQELYSNIYDTELDWLEEVDGVKLSDAIRYSIETKGCMLYEKLQSKSTEFGGDNINQTYLRVTLGVNYYNSPGFPYVLELWPKGHYSPIHNHGNAHAVIKVLFGGPTVHIYNKHALTDGSTDYDQRELFHVNVVQNDFTWISPQWYQTHKLFNHGDDFCATIQCYQYATVDNRHWPYFDFLSETGDIDEFFPNSDYTFSYMRQHVLDEYTTQTCDQ